MTWGEFKAKVAALGVADEDELSWIDWQGGEQPVLFPRTDIKLSNPPTGKAIVS